MKKILMIAAAAAVCLAACSKSEDGVPGDRTLRITPTIGNPSLTPAAMTAASTRATDTDFELGDKVGLKVTMTADGKDVVAVVQTANLDANAYARHTAVRFSFEPRLIHLFDPETEKNLI